MNRTALTRRGFISMLASVPIVSVAAPRIFLPVHHDVEWWMQHIQRDLQESLQQCLVNSGPIAWDNDGLSKVREAAESVLGGYDPPIIRLSTTKGGIIRYTPGTSITLR
jgi:hypothetical protein